MPEFKPRFRIPEAAIKNPQGIDYPGFVSWTNRFNGFTVAAVHYWSDPEKQSDAWYTKAIANMRYDQIEREMEINFESRAGQKAFWFLEGQRDKYRIKDIPLDAVPKHWRIIAGLDYGSREPTSIHLYGIDEHRRFYSLWEFYKPSHYKEIARALKGTLEDNPHPLWPRIEKIIADPSLFRNDQENPLREELQSRADLLRNEGIWNLYRGTNDRLAGLERVKEMLSYFPNQPETKPSMFFCERCERQWWELTNIVYDEIPPHMMMEKNQKEDVKQKNDHCFSRGTLISSPSGPIPIEKIKSGDLVHTRGGPMPVEAAGPTEIAQTYDLKFSNGSNLTCTANHPIWTENRGFVRADEIRYEDICVTNQPSKKYSLTGLFLDVIQNLVDRTYEIITGANQSIISTASGFSTERYGNLIMGQYPLDITCTTRTATHSTIGQKIWNVCQRASILASTEKKLPKKERLPGVRPERWPLNGMDQQQGVSGTQSTQRKHGKEESRKQSGANLVVALSPQRSTTLPMRCFAPTDANLERAGNPAQTTSSALAVFVGENLPKTDSPKQKHAAGFAAHLCERKPAKIEQVYNMRVRDFHEYYANGILVSNSYDDLRYSLMSVEAPSDKPIIDVEDRMTLDSIEKQLVREESRYDND